VCDEVAHIPRAPFNAGHLESGQGRRPGARRGMEPVSAMKISPW
jgi:hypothetical protein